MRRHQSVYRRLLSVYPAEFRREYRDAMTQLFGDRLRAEGGGARTLLFWLEMLVDLATTAFKEHLEITMKSLRTDWWRMAALPVSVLICVGGVGNMIADTEGALFGRIAYAAASVIGVGFVMWGLRSRGRNRKLGSTLIAAGLMPGLMLLLMVWFIPALLLGFVSAAISLAAFLDAPKAPQVLERANG